MTAQTATAISAADSVTSGVLSTAIPTSEVCTYNLGRSGKTSSSTILTGGFPSDRSVPLRLLAEWIVVGAVVMLVRLANDSVGDPTLEARVEMLKLRERERESER
jgi:hypothetical protein